MISNVKSDICTQRDMTPNDRSLGILVHKCNIMDVTCNFFAGNTVLFILNKEFTAGVK